jgi:hypothetical protein
MTNLEVWQIFDSYPLAGPGRIGRFNIITTDIASNWISEGELRPLPAASHQGLLRIPFYEEGHCLVSVTLQIGQ